MTVEDEEEARNFEDPPPVILWFKLYAAAMAFMYLAAAGFIPYLFLSMPQDGESDETMGMVLGVGLGLLCLVLFFASLVPLVLRPKPWVWVYDLVIICFGLTSACTIPVCIPLLIFWVKPETKRWFGRPE